jgi:hypothetical protein
MKKYFTLIIVTLFSFTTIAQRISKISLINGTGNLESFTIALDDNAVINITQEGNIIDYGTEYFSERVNNYSRMEKYNGRIDMFTATDDKSFAGKLKYIGRTPVTYYASYEDEFLRGKIKMIGTLAITYYMAFENENLKGKIKSIGSNQISYFSNFDNQALKGKLKTVGYTNLNFYSSFEDSAIRGRVKSIGSVSFTYYPSYDRQFAGGMKTGSYTQVVNGITFLVR